MEEKHINPEEIDNEWEEEEKMLNKYMDQSASEQRLLRLYSHFSNFPKNVKKNLIINLIFIIGLTALLFGCIFYLDYKRPLLFVVYAAIVLFLAWKVFITWFYLKHAHFLTFTGKIIESYPVGSKLTGNKHFVLKLLSDDGKEIAFPYYDSETLCFDQYITLFINNDAKVELSEFGPYVSQYIEAIPTDEIESRMKFASNDSSELKAQDYLNK